MVHMHECHSHSTGTRAPGSANIPTNIDDPDDDDADDDDDGGLTWHELIFWIVWGLICGGVCLVITGYSIWKRCLR